MDALSLSANPPSRDELLKSLLWAFSQGEVKQFVQLCQLAAEFHPNELRAAFALCLGSDALEDSCNRAVTVASKAQAKAEEASWRAQRILDEIQCAAEKLNAQIGALFIRLDVAGKRVDDIARRVGEGKS